MRRFTPARARRIARGVAVAVVLQLAGTAGVASAGLSPAQIHKAYDLPRHSPVRQTIAVVVAYHAPNAIRDLATFTARFKLAPCRASGGCFRRVNQRGAASPLPAADPTGGNFVAEAVLGTQVARGVCQNCRILLVEADSDSRADLAAAVKTAVRLGADEVATSYLLADDESSRSAYNYPGVAITAAPGDNGYFDGAFYPAALPGVVTVGGTRLRLGAGGRYAGESVWNDGPGERTTSGCGIFTPVPSWQKSEARAVGCGTKRSIVDIAAVASPGAEVYSTTPISGMKGWLEIGGTSFASPLIAGVFALAGGVPSGVSAPRLLYQNRHARRGGLRDIVKGSNGSCTGFVCRARKGFDGPTGMGTPKGLAAFRRYR